ncbi:hypothetical protein W97_07529 [Coniosporium apollinis CBS 100218]|uniref:Benzoate 4-monooxygenase cytochrome P450 n=1 Tax=Coniosporium apollinis (strain CBS 100218) TaxID=1168221 RepID=R7Z2X1_CONA1|nr:uncharacterized protein W97_07529 [Coniosporium apollinis CBS 100218]EON68271.1 hypothetical protein W97_07529 [Coniosporium apollinis CBS 100218]
MEVLNAIRIGISSLRYYQLIAYVAILVILYYVINAVYRVTLHPLAKYPGPFLQRISDWPLVFHCYGGNRHIIEYQNHQKYGKIVRYGPNSLSFSTATSMQTIHHAKANIKKGEWYKTLDISAGAPSIQMMIDKSEHAIRRRTISPAFSERALRDAEGLIAINARKLADAIGTLPNGANQGDWTQPKNMNDWATYFGFDFVSDLGYGRCFGMVEDRDNRWIPGVLKSASRFLYYVGYLPFAPILRPLMGTSIQDYVGGQSAADSLKYTRLANGRLAERMELERQLKDSGKETTRKDTFHYLLNTKDPVTGRRFTTEELQADSSLIIAAGSDGVGLAVSSTIFYLLRYPTTLSKLTDEIRSAFADVSEIRHPKLGSLSYLTACVDESMRLCPAKPSTLPREVLSGGMIIDGHHIPQGISVGTPTYVLHRDEDIYPEPWEYRPERWIVDEKSGVSSENVAAARSAYCPFLIGPMNCIGKNMAYIAVKQALAHLLFRYDIRQAGAELTGGGRPDLEKGRQREDEYQMTDYIIGFRDGPMIELRSRL